MLGKRPRGSPCARWQFAMPPRDVARGGHQGLRPRRGCAVSPGSFSSLLFSAEIGFTDNSVRSRSEEHTSELQSLMRISYAVFCLKKKNILHITTLHSIYLTTNNTHRNT